uniref:Uncharacterized protein n=1 Tax=Trichogramma kaykai TaxID=54128 RepID=A0ABD2W868_9HYME
MDQLMRLVKHPEIKLFKGRKAFYTLGKLFYSKHLNIKVKNICYTLLIRSIITYGALVWHNQSASTIEKLRAFKRLCEPADVNNPAERKYGIQIGGFYEIKENGRGHFPPLEASVIDRYYTADSPNPDEAFDKEEAEKKIRKKKQAKTKQNQDQQNQKSIIAKKKLLIENDNLKCNSLNAEQSKVN